MWYQEAGQYGLRMEIDIHRFFTRRPQTGREGIIKKITDENGVEHSKIKDISKALKDYY